MPPVGADDDDDYGTEIEYDDALEETIQQAESQSQAVVPTGRGNGTVVTDGYPSADPPPLADLEDMPAMLSPFAQFRRRGFLSVSDLVATVWCEVQYDYRLRTLPFLPPEKRPEVIKTAKGAEIKVDRVKVEDKEKILKRGEKIHLKLEKEIFPEKITVETATAEDAWGLRLLTMISSLEALLTGGKCRELPVVGFVGDVLVYGIIDEIVRDALPGSSSLPQKAKAEDMRQMSLDTFFRSSQPAKPPLPRRTHRLRVSDSKTRASGALPREGDTLGGRLQVMLYKELLDTLLRPPTDAAPDREYPSTLLPSSQVGVLSSVFGTLGLDSNAEFTPGFRDQAAVLIISNRLRHGARESTTLGDLVATWYAYVTDLGLGASEAGDGMTDDKLTLVYRRAVGRTERSSKSRAGTRLSKRLRRTKGNQRRDARDSGSETQTEHTGIGSQSLVDTRVMAEDTQLQLAIQMSLTHDATPTAQHESDSDVDLRHAIALSLEAGDRESLGDQDANRGENATTGDTDLAGQGTTTLSRQPQSPMAIGDRPVDSTSITNRSKATAAIAGRAAITHNTPSIGRRRSASPSYDTGSERERSEDAVAWVVERSQASEVPADPGFVAVPVSSQESRQLSTPGSSPATSQSQPQAGKNAGDIIGTHRFAHDRKLLAMHLHHVLGYWRGMRDPQGVGPHDTRRCGWCEFEEGCEWRAAKAEEAMQLYRSRASFAG